MHNKKSIKLILIISLLFFIFPKNSLCVSTNICNLKILPPEVIERIHYAYWLLHTNNPEAIIKILKYFSYDDLLKDKLPAFLKKPHTDLEYVYFYTQTKEGKQFQKFLKNWINKILSYKEYAILYPITQENNYNINQKQVCISHYMDASPLSAALRFSPSKQTKKFDIRKFIHTCSLSFGYRINQNLLENGILLSLNDPQLYINFCYNGGSACQDYEFGNFIYLENLNPNIEENGVCIKTTIQQAMLIRKSLPDLEEYSIEKCSQYATERGIPQSFLLIDIKFVKFDWVEVYDDLPKILKPVFIGKINKIGIVNIHQKGIHKVCNIITQKNW